MGSQINIINTTGKKLEKKPGINQTNLTSNGQSLSIQSTFFEGNIGGTSGGTGTPGGNNTEIQFNDNGYFAGSSNLLFNSAENSLNIGYKNNIYNSYNSNIIGGGNKDVIFGVNGSVITGHTISESSSSFIIGGGYIEPGACGPYSYNLVNKICSGSSSSIIGSFGSYVYKSVGGSIINSAGSKVSDSPVSVIINSLESNICQGSSFSSIISSLESHVNGAVQSGIIFGRRNGIVNTEGSISVGGEYNTLSNSNNSSIIGGCNNTLSSSTRSVIIGGNSLNLISEDDTVFVPKLKVNNTITVQSGNTFSDGVTGEYVFGTSNVTIFNGIIVSIS